jgi:hypothetical protein
VVIPARLSWGAIRRLLQDLGVNVIAFLGIFLIAAFVAYLRGLSFRACLNSEGVRSLSSVSLGCCAGLILARIVPRLFGKTVVTLSPSQFVIEWNPRIRSATEVFPTAILHSFRFVERSSDVLVQNKIGQNEVQFRDTHWTHDLGTGVTRAEAEALIAKMMEVYPFPQHLQTEPATRAEDEQNVAFS